MCVVCTLSIFKPWLSADMFWICFQSYLVWQKSTFLQSEAVETWHPGLYFYCYFNNIWIFKSISVFVCWIYKLMLFCVGMESVFLIILSLDDLQIILGCHMAFLCTHPRQISEDLVFSLEKLGFALPFVITTFQ